MSRNWSERSNETYRTTIIYFSTAKNNSLGKTSSLGRPKDQCLHPKHIYNAKVVHNPGGKMLQIHNSGGSPYAIKNRGNY